MKITDEDYIFYMKHCETNYPFTKTMTSLKEESKKRLQMRLKDNPTPLFGFRLRFQLFKKNA